MYAADGRTMLVDNNEIEAYQNVGWYTMPVQSIYSSNGRVMVIPQSEPENYQAVDWYETPVQKNDDVVNNIEINIDTEKSYRQDSRTLWAVFTKKPDGGLNVRSQPNHDSQLVAMITDNTFLEWLGQSEWGAWF